LQLGGKLLGRDVAHHLVGDGQLRRRRFRGRCLGLGIFEPGDELGRLVAGEPAACLALRGKATASGVI